MRKSCAFLSFGVACILGVALPSFAGSEARPGSIHPITAQSWSFECVDSSACGSNGKWITTRSQPGTVRLWDSGTSWSVLNSGTNTYNWTKLDTWLDLLAQHQPSTVIFTFGHVPCFIASIIRRSESNTGAS